MIDTEEQEVGASHVTETQQTHDEPYDPRDSKWFTPAIRGEKHRDPRPRKGSRRAAVAERRVLE